MAEKRSPGEHVFDFANVLFMLLIVVLTLYPFLYVAFSSLSNPARLTAHSGPMFWPLGLEFGSYAAVLKNPMIRIGYLNTLLYVFVGTSLNLLMTSLGAYVLSRKRYFMKRIFMFTIVFTMFFNGGLVPFYLNIRMLGILNTRWALLLPPAISTYNLIVMRTSFAAIPDSMEESAKMDGANDFIILFRIILPLSLPVVAVMVLFYGVYHWSAWFNASILLQTRTLYPLQLVLREILIQSSTDSMSTGVSGMDKEMIGESIKYATIMVATLPILFVYPFLQKYFVKGVMVGAIKE